MAAEVTSWREVRIDWERSPVETTSLAGLELSASPGDVERVVRTGGAAGDDVACAGGAFHRVSVSGTVVVPDGFVALVTGEVRARIGEPEEVDLFVEGGATLSSAWERAAREHLDLADSDPLGVVRFVVSGRPTELVWGLDVTRWEHHAAGSALRSVVLWRGASD